MQTKKRQGYSDAPDCQGMNVCALTSLSAAMITTFLGVFILIKEPRNPLNRVYFFFCLAVAYVGFTEFELRISAAAVEAFHWVKAASFWTLGPAAFFHFAYLYTRGKRGRRSGWVVPLVYAIALGDGLLYLTTDLIIRGVQRESWGWTASSPSFFASGISRGSGILSKKAGRGPLPSATSRQPSYSS